MAWLTQTVRAARACTTDREKQIKAMTFAFISHAQKTQTPFCFAKYHKHISNCSYNQNPPFLGSWSGLLFNHLSLCNHSCCAFAHRNALHNFSHIWQQTIAQLFPSQEIPWGNRNTSGRGTVETAAWISTPTGCHDFLSSSFLFHLFVVSPHSVFLPGSGNRLPHVWFPSWKYCENSIRSLNGISAFGEIWKQSAHAQRCQILQMLESSDKTGIMWGSLLNPPTLMILTTSHTLKLLALAWKQDRGAVGILQAITSFWLRRFTDPIVNSLLQLEAPEASTQPCSVRVWRQ